MRGQLNKWLSSFLKDRMMNAVCEGKHSESVSVESGVPKGTVLGPLMSLCHINDFPNKSVSSRMTVFYIGQLKAKEIKIYYRMICVN